MVTFPPGFLRKRTLAIKVYLQADRRLLVTRTLRTFSQFSEFLLIKKGQAIKPCAKGHGCLGLGERAGGLGHAFTLLGFLFTLSVRFLASTRLIFGVRRDLG